MGTAGRDPEKRAWFRRKSYEKAKQHEGLDLRGGWATSEAYHLQCLGLGHRRRPRANREGSEGARPRPTDRAWPLAISGKRKGKMTASRNTRALWPERWPETVSPNPTAVRPPQPRPRWVAILGLRIRRTVGAYGEDAGPFNHDCRLPPEPSRIACKTARTV